MTPIRLEQGTSVAHWATSPQIILQHKSNLRDTVDTDMICLDGPALHCGIYSCLISIIMPETLELSSHSSFLMAAEDDYLFPFLCSNLLEDIWLQNVRFIACMRAGLHVRVTGRTSIQPLVGGEMKRLNFLWLKFCRRLQGRVFVLWEKITAHSTKG